MSPYRVSIAAADGGTAVLAAMLSIDKKDGTRYIFIIHKLSPELLGNDKPSDKELAYAQTCKRNANIVAVYAIHKTEDNRYAVSRCTMLGVGTSKLPNLEYTQSSCLSAAMHDYCSINNHNIISIL